MGDRCSGEELAENDEKAMQADGESVKRSRLAGGDPPFPFPGSDARNPNPPPPSSTSTLPSLRRRALLRLQDLLLSDVVDPKIFLSGDHLIGRLLHRAKRNPWFHASGSQSAQQHYSSYGRGSMRQDVDEWVSASDPSLLVVHLPIDGLEIGLHPCQTMMNPKLTKQIQKQSGQKHLSDVQIWETHSEDYIDNASEIAGKLAIVTVIGTVSYSRHEINATKDTKKDDNYKQQIKT